MAQDVARKALREIFNDNYCRKRKANKSNENGNDEEADYDRKEAIREGYNDEDGENMFK
jgi:hypothetical protein